jgi:hypothetical protein
MLPIEDYDGPGANSGHSALEMLMKQHFTGTIRPGQEQVPSMQSPARSWLA